MEQQEEQKNMKAELLVMLNIGSLILVLGSVFMIQLFSVMYGAASGIVAQSITDNDLASAALQAVSAQIPQLHSSMLQSYVVLVIALILFTIAFLMLVRRTERGASTIRKYSMTHGAFSVVYLLLIFIVFSQFYADISFLYVDAIYFGLALCLIVDGYLSYAIRVQEQPRRVRARGSLSINPSTPFSNVLNIQEQLFSNLSGNLRIIDKHFNSQALANFHRIMSGMESGIKTITVLTSTDLLDSSFQSNVNDLRRELEGKGIRLDVRIMDDRDRMEQHERVIMDDRIAYKIPPFNIINKRSEHINRIGFEESKRRFDQLYSRAITLENQAIKNARAPSPSQDQNQNPQK
jgi:hypothetical protein